MTLKACSEEQLPEILEIYNHAIVHTTALYDYKTRNMETMNTWYADKLAHNHPIIGAFDNDGTLLGFATYGMYRVRPAYKYTIEHSVYVRHDKRGHGTGKTLLKAIIQKAEEQHYHVMVGVIDTENEISRLLHEAEGFELNGIWKEVGYKFGKWLDAAYYQLILKTPERPTED